MEFFMMDGLDALGEAVGMRMVMESMLLVGMMAKRWWRGRWLPVSML